MMIKKILYFNLFLAMAGCQQKKSVKIDTAMRRHIDTTAARKINLLSVELDQYCRDSTDVLVQRAADSMLRVRKQEILNQK
jgi:hypothetical protein